MSLLFGCFTENVDLISGNQTNEDYQGNGNCTTTESLEAQNSEESILSKGIAKNSLS